MFFFLRKTTTFIDTNQGIRVFSSTSELYVNKADPDNGLNADDIVSIVRNYDTDDELRDYFTKKKESTMALYHSMALDHPEGSKERKATESAGEYELETVRQQEESLIGKPNYSETLPVSTSSQANVDSGYPSNLNNSGFEVGESSAMAASRAKRAQEQSNSMTEEEEAFSILSLIPGFSKMLSTQKKVPGVSDIGPNPLETKSLSSNPGDLPL